MITTDAIAMGALVERHSLPTACALALAAGADMVLNKMETPFRDQGFLETLAFVRDGRISETELDAKVRRILRMKYRRGLFSRPTVDPAAATAEVGRGRYRRLARTVARRCCLVLHDRGKALPLSPAEPLLVIEQQLGAQNIPNTPAHHRLSFSEAVLGRHGTAIAADTAFIATEQDLAVVLPLAERVGTVLMTNHYARGNRGSNGALAARLAAAGKRVVLVTNSPYPETAVAGAAASICCFATNPESYRAAIDIAFGQARPEGSWPLTGYRASRPGVGQGSEVWS